MSESLRLIPAGNDRQGNGSNGNPQVSINMNYASVNGYVDNVTNNFVENQNNRYTVFIEM